MFFKLSILLFSLSNRRNFKGEILIADKFSKYFKTIFDISKNLQISSLIFYFELRFQVLTKKSRQTRFLFLLDFFFRGWFSRSFVRSFIFFFNGLNHLPFFSGFHSHLSPIPFLRKFKKKRISKLCYIFIKDKRRERKEKKK